MLLFAPFVFPSWIWIAIFSTIFAGAATDIYSNRDEIELRYEGVVLQMDRDDWIVVLAMVWTEVVVCILAVALNEIFVDAWILS